MVLYIHAQDTEIDTKCIQTEKKVYKIVGGGWLAGPAHARGRAVTAGPSAAFWAGPGRLPDIDLLKEANRFAAHRFA